MSHEDPHSIIQILNNLPPAVAGVLMSIFISILRVIYDEDETRWMRTILEAALCGALTLTINSGVVAMGFGMNWAIFIGGTVGYFGSQKVRCWALKLVNRKMR